MNEWGYALIIFASLLIVEYVDAEGWERICNDPHVVCEVK